MATHSSFLAWEIPWTEEPGLLQSMGLQSQTERLSTNTHTDKMLTSPHDWEDSVGPGLRTVCGPDRRLQRLAGPLYPVCLLSRPRPSTY